MDFRSIDDIHAHLSSELRRTGELPKEITLTANNLIELIHTFPDRFSSIHWDGRSLWGIPIKLIEPIHKE